MFIEHRVLSFLGVMMARLGYRAAFSFAVILGSVVGLSSLANAEGTGKNGVFTIHNDTDDNTVVGFNTNDGSGWSTNWLSRSLGPGKSSDMQFSKPGGKCKQRLRVGWKGKNGGEVLDDPINIDICDASNVYLHDNEITYD
jgi:hypothetical protein